MNLCPCRPSGDPTGNGSDGGRPSLRSRPPRGTVQCSMRSMAVGTVLRDDVVRLRDGRRLAYAEWGDPNAGRGTLRLHPAVGRDRRDDGRLMLVGPFRTASVRFTGPGAVAAGAVLRYSA